MNFKPAELQLASAAWRARTTLRRTLKSAFSDERYMRSGATFVDWRDYLKYLRAMQIEVVCSDDPAGILYGEWGETNYFTREISGRALAREHRFGKVDALFADPNTRHLVELSTCTQNLSRILERPSSEEFEVRSHLFAQAVESENLEAMREFDDLRPDADTFVNKLLQDVGGVAPRNHIQFDWRNGDSLEVYPAVDKTLAGFDVSVAAFLTTPERRKRIYFHRLLPNNFESYRRCDNTVRAVVALGAWRAAISVIGSFWQCSDPTRSAN